jgi:histidyl-tRNA synthetase
MVVIVIGQKEVLDGTAIIRDMDAGSQEIVDVKKVVHEIKKKLERHVEGV